MATHVYLAARFSRKDELQHHAAELRRDGLEVTSRWLTGEHDGTPETELANAESRRFAHDDLEDIDRAQVLLWFGDPPDSRGTRGGASWECGYAYAMGIHIVVVGHKQSIFAHLRDVVYCPDFEAARVYVGGLRTRSNGRVAA